MLLELVVYDSSLSYRRWDLLRLTTEQWRTGFDSKAKCFLEPATRATLLPRLCVAVGPIFTIPQYSMGQ